MDIYDNPYKTTKQDRGLNTVLDEHGLTLPEILLLLGRREGLVIADYGYGKGFVLKSLITSNDIGPDTKLVGIDIARSFVVSSNDHLVLLQADFGALPVASNAINLGFASYSYGYYAETTTEFLMQSLELYRVTARGGLVYLFVDVALGQVQRTYNSVWNFINNKRSLVRLYKPSQVLAPIATMNDYFIYHGFFYTLRRIGFEIIRAFPADGWGLVGEFDYTEVLSITLRKR